MRIKIKFLLNVFGILLGGFLFLFFQNITFAVNNHGYDDCISMWQGGIPVFDVSKIQCGDTYLPPIGIVSGKDDYVLSEMSEDCFEHDGSGRRIKRNGKYVVKCQPNTEYFTHNGFQTVYLNGVNRKNIKETGKYTKKGSDGVFVEVASENEASKYYNLYNDYYGKNDFGMNKQDMMRLHKNLLLTRYPLRNSELSRELYWVKLPDEQGGGYKIKYSKGKNSERFDTPEYDYQVREHDPKLYAQLNMVRFANMRPGLPEEHNGAFIKINNPFMLRPDTNDDPESASQTSPRKRGGQLDLQAFGFPIKGQETNMAELIGGNLITFSLYTQKGITVEDLKKGYQPQASFLTPAKYYIDTGNTKPVKFKFREIYHDGEKRYGRGDITEITRNVRFRTEDETIDFEVKEKGDNQGYSSFGGYNVSFSKNMDNNKAPNNQIFIDNDGVPFIIDARYSYFLNVGFCGDGIVNGPEGVEECDGGEGCFECSRRPQLCGNGLIDNPVFGPDGSITERSTDPVCGVENMPNNEAPREECDFKEWEGLEIPANLNGGIVGDKYKLNENPCYSLNDADEAAKHGRKPCRWKVPVGDLKHLKGEPSKINPVGLIDRSINGTLTDDYKYKGLQTVAMRKWASVNGYFYSTLMNNAVIGNEKIIEYIENDPMGINPQPPASGRDIYFLLGVPRGKNMYSHNYFRNMKADYLTLLNNMKNPGFSLKYRSSMFNQPALLRGCLVTGDAILENKSENISALEPLKCELNVRQLNGNNYEVDVKIFKIDETGGEATINRAVPVQLSIDFGDGNIAGPSQVYEGATTNHNFDGGGKTYNIQANGVFRVALDKPEETFVCNTSLASETNVPVNCDLSTSTGKPKFNNVKELLEANLGIYSY